MPQLTYFSTASRPTAIFVVLFPSNIYACTMCVLPMILLVLSSCLLNRYQSILDQLSSIVYFFIYKSIP
jgi:hypothetical protein